MTRQQGLRLYTDMMRTIQDPQLKAHLQEHNRLACEFGGFEHPLLKSGCLLTNYATFYFFYLPPFRGGEANIYYLDDYLRKTINDVVRESTEQPLYALDYDPKTKSMIYQPVLPYYHDKKKIQMICQRGRFPGLYQILIEIESYLFCNSVLESA